MVNWIELKPYHKKFQYAVERSSNRIGDGKTLVHLRMLSPDEKIIEFFSYVFDSKLMPMVPQLEIEQLRKMELNIIEKLHGKGAREAQRQMYIIEDMKNKINNISKKKKKRIYKSYKK